MCLASRWSRTYWSPAAWTSTPACARRNQAEPDCRESIQPVRALLVYRAAHNVGVVIDVTAFRAFEQAGWDARADGYERFFTAVSEHNVGPILDAAEVRVGSRVLDAGCGPGNLAAAAASRGASVVGPALSAAMVALARKHHPQIDFRQADAEQIPFADLTFDSVVSNLLIPHLPRPDAGIIELVRVLKPGGRLAASMWDVPARSRLVGIMWEAIAEVGAPPPTGI